MGTRDTSLAQSLPRAGTASAAHAVCVGIRARESSCTRLLGLGPDCIHKQVVFMEDITYLLGKRKTSNIRFQENEKKPKIVAFTPDQLKKSGEERYPDLVFVSCTNELGSGVLTCSKRDVHNHPPL